jgi:hypothetical protein
MNPKTLDFLKKKSLCGNIGPDTSEKSKNIDFPYVQARNGEK